MTKLPHLASYSAVGLAATIASRECPLFLRPATFARTPTSMSRNSRSSDRLLTGWPWPGMMMVLSVVIARFASAARIEPSMLPPVELELGCPAVAGQCWSSREGLQR